MVIDPVPDCLVCGAPGRATQTRDIKANDGTVLRRIVLRAVCTADPKHVAADA